MLNVPVRQSMGHRQIELEAESVSFLVCSRNGVTSKAETYLASYVAQNTAVDDIDLYQIMRAAGQIETLLGLTAPNKVQMSESYPATGALPDLVVAADWSTVETKRWMVRGERVRDGYVVHPPEPVGDHKSLVARLQRTLPNDHRLLIGFDFPIGLPVEYAQKASVESFLGPFSGRWPDAGEWERFYQISDLPSLRQPFFPLPKQQSGSFRAQLAVALGFLISRLCDDAASARPTTEAGGVLVLYSSGCAGGCRCHRRVARCDPACTRRSQAMALRWRTRDPARQTRLPSPRSIPPKPIRTSASGLGAELEARRRLAGPGSVRHRIGSSTLMRVQFA